jgi:PIN domain nuclease of toxin-antitoxin system
LRLLLDTHTLIWYTIGDPQLSRMAHALIADAANEVLVSPASFWEIAIKVSLGKLTLHTSYDDFIDLCLNRYGFRGLPIEPAHTAWVAKLPFPSNHKDPFDRLLIAQAAVESIPIVSADAALDVYAIRRLW